MSASSTDDVLTLTAKIVSTHVSHNSIVAEAIPELIKSVYDTLSNASSYEDASRAEALVPAVPIKKSVFPDYIVCLEDGRKLKMLKRHLNTTYNMTPAEYRTKWSLPSNYPMVAPNYAERRSVLAKEIGLGRNAAESEPVAAEPTVTVGRARMAKGSKGRTPLPACGSIIRD